MFFSRSTAAIGTPEDLLDLLYRVDIDKPAPLSILRGGEADELTVTRGRAPVT